MSIITYPLNGVTYDAEDVSTYLCTRTSGVYAKDTNYAVSVTIKSDGKAGLVFGKQGSQGFGLGAGIL